MNGHCHHGEGVLLLFGVGGVKTLLLLLHLLLLPLGTADGLQRDSAVPALHSGGACRCVQLHAHCGIVRQSMQPLLQAAAGPGGPARAAAAARHWLPAAPPAPRWQEGDQPLPPLAYSRKVIFTVRRRIFSPSLQLLQHYSCSTPPCVSGA